MIPEKVQRTLNAHGLRVLEFEAGTTPTVTAAATKVGVSEGQIAKSLLFVGASGHYFMVVCAGDKKISAGALKRLVGEKVSMANAEETEAVTGFPPGGVCPFAVEGASIYIDKSLAAWETVYPAAGNDASAVPTSFGQLLRITGGSPCEVTQSGSDPRT